MIPAWGWFIIGPAVLLTAGWVPLIMLGLDQWVYNKWKGRKK